MNTMIVSNEDPQILKRMDLFAKVLEAMASSGALDEDECKPAIGMLVRQASETKHWHDSSHYRSRPAAEMISAAIKSGEIRTQARYHSWCKSNLAHEHVVPVSVVMSMIRNLENRTEDHIKKILVEYSVRATITKDENSALVHTSSMPPCFTDENHAHYNCPFSRYRVSQFNGVAMVDLLVPRPASGSWYAG